MVRLEMKLTKKEIEEQVATSMAIQMSLKQVQDIHERNQEGLLNLWCKQEFKDWKEIIQMDRKSLIFEIWKGRSNNLCLKLIAILCGILILNWGFRVLFNVV